MKYSRREERKEKGAAEKSEGISQFNSDFYFSFCYQFACLALAAAANSFVISHSPVPIYNTLQKRNRSVSEDDEIKKLKSEEAKKSLVFFCTNKKQF